MEKLNAMMCLTIKIRLNGESKMTGQIVSLPYQIMNKCMKNQKMRQIVAGICCALSAVGIVLGVIEKNWSATAWATSSLLWCFNSFMYTLTV